MQFRLVIRICILVLIAGFLPSPTPQFLFIPVYICIMLNDMFYRLEDTTGQQIKFSILTYLSLVLTWAMFAKVAKCTRDEVYAQLF